MTSVSKTILTNWQLRHTRKQKKAFSEYAVKIFSDLGYYTRVETKKGFTPSNNIIIGDLSNAKTIVTAHYDTPSRRFIPFFVTLDSTFQTFLTQFSTMIAVFAVCMYLAKYTNFFIGFVLFDLLLWLLVFGPAKKNNANNNTSGLMALYEVASRLPRDRKEEVAFVLFDNKELAHAGSNAFVKQHEVEFFYNKLVINLDCVGVGDAIIFLASKHSIPFAKKAATFAPKDCGKEFSARVNRNFVYISDSNSFPVAFNVSAFTMDGGPILKDLYNEKDTVLDESNIDALASALVAYLSQDCRYDKHPKEEDED